MSFSVSYQNIAMSGEIDFTGKAKLTNDGLQIIPEESDIFWTTRIPDRRTKIAVKAFRNLLRQKLENKLKFQYGKKLAKLMRKLNQKLNQMQLKKRIKFHCKFNRFAVRKFNITSKAITIVPILEGHGFVKINPLQ